MQRYLALFGELERVGEQVLEDLLQALGVGLHAAREHVGHFQLKAELLVVGNMTEGAIDVILQFAEGDVADIDDDRARFDLGQVENVVDEGQQVVAR